MRKILPLFCSFLLSVTFQTTKADPETEQAIQEVQLQMKNANFGENAAKESAEARDVHNYVKGISGNPQQTQEIYDLAAEVLGNMKGLNPEQMQKLLEAAKNDPSQFADSWTPEQKEKLKKLSNRLPSANQKKP